MDMPMTLDEARQELGDDIKSDNGLYNSMNYLGWNIYNTYATLDGDFDANQLEAIAIWMRANYCPRDISKLPK
jgi:hypothetical protein